MLAILLAGAAAARAAVPKHYKMPFHATTKAEAVAWQTAARKRLLELVEAQEPRVSTAEAPLDLQIGRLQDKGPYLLFPCSFRGNGEAGTRYRAMLGVPKAAGPHPAMLCLDGHSGSYEPFFDLDSPYHALADRFARGGYVVLVPSFPHKQYAAMMLWDLMRCLDILAGRPEVDPDRIGVAGLSMGGEWTMWLAACDERPRVAVVSGWMCTTEGVFSVRNCPCWRLPGFVELMAVCEVHLLIAPRPLLFESATRDNCFPVEHTKAGFQRIRARYALFGAQDAVRQDVFEGIHEWHGKVAYPFVDAVLGGHAAQ